MTRRPSYKIHSSRRLVRVVLAAGVAIGAIATASAFAPDRAALAQGARDSGAEQFVGTQAQRVISVLNDKGDSTAKITAFRAIVDQIADVPRITTFVLGKYARTITPAQKAKFAPVFREYAQNVYETRLGDYHGEKVRVTGSVVRKPGDVVVNSEVYGGDRSQPVPVAWRVLGGGSSWKVVDVQASGIWLAITQQQDFVSTIDNNGGNIDVLIAQLQTQIQNKRTARGK